MGFNSRSFLRRVPLPHVCGYHHRERESEIGERTGRREQKGGSRSGMELAYSIWTSVPLRLSTSRCCKANYVEIHDINTPFGFVSTGPRRTLQPCNVLGPTRMFAHTVSALCAKARRIKLVTTQHESSAHTHTHTYTHRHTHTSIRTDTQQEQTCIRADCRSALRRHTSLSAEQTRHDR